MLFAAELVDLYVNRAFWIDQYHYDPRAFWGWHIPYNLTVKGVFLALFVVRGRRATIALLIAQILIFLVPYWQAGAIAPLSERLFGY